MSGPADPLPTGGEPSTATATLPIAQVERRAALLLLGLLVLVLGSAAYLLYARGAFEPTQRLVLVADNSEGVTVGMDLTFSGFPIGRVRRIELTPEGQARVVVDVPGLPWRSCWPSCWPSVPALRSTSCSTPVTNRGRPPLRRPARPRRSMPDSRSVPSAPRNCPDSMSQGSPSSTARAR